MKHIKLRVLAIISLVVVACIGCSACSPNVESQLQKNNWTVVSDNGESYTAEFSENTASFSNQFLTRGFSYKIKDGILTMKDKSDTAVYKIIQKGNQFKFKAKNSHTEKQFGNLTLSQKK